MRTDSSAVVWIASRAGLGKTRHIAVQLQFLQSELRAGAHQLEKWPGTQNPADLLTKHLVEKTIGEHMERLGLSRRGGRAAGTPFLDDA